MSEQKVLDYINEKYNGGMSLMDITRLFRGNSLPDYFAEDVPEQVRRYAQLELSRMILHENALEQQRITKKDLDHSLFQD